MRMTLGLLRGIIQEASEPAGQDPELAREENEWDELISIYSDMYKERHGIRPRWKYDELRQMSLEDLRAAVDALGDEPYDDDFGEYSMEPQPHEPGYYPEPEATVGAEEMRGVHPMEDLPSKSGMKRNLPR